MIIIETGFALLLVIVGLALIAPPIVLIMTKYFRWFAERISKL